VNLLAGKCLSDILKQRGRNDHIPHSAPFDDQDTANGGIGGKINRLRHEGRPDLSVWTGLAGWLGFETTVYPEVLLRRLPDIIFQQCIDPPGIGFHVAAGEIR
jgi:hypothetical protein